MLVLVTAVLFVAPLYIVKEAEFGGADGEAEVVIEEIAPDYEPIFEPLIEPASGEIESMLFALQAAIGAGIIGFGLGKITRNKSGHDHL
ncbi:MAG: energy-coupling factor ABC transporter substrate-binding protein [Peptostreptococcaceae bacterium]|nr:energy-coupling factor ABC transporter substrate-binding protein [Peptostreptococcaceae bacterium]